MQIGEFSFLHFSAKFAILSKIKNNAKEATKNVTNPSNKILPLETAINLNLFFIKKLVMVNPRNKPEFKRHMSEAYVRIGESWRKPRGIHSKVRIGEKGKPRRPKIGYGAPKSLRFLHPSGYKEVLVRNLKDLEKVDKEKEAIRIASSIGKKKREEIIKVAKERNIWILNP